MKRSAGILGLIAALSISAAAYGQGVGFGAPISSNSGIDISGSWSYGGDQDADYGTAAGAVADYGGIPLNEAGRLYALAWDASRMTVRQQQCAGYGIPYAYFSPGNFRFWEERDPHTQQLIAIHMWFQTSEVRTNHLDGRTSAPACLRAAHLRWIFHGQVGQERADHHHHASETGWLRGNGVPSSDEATVVEKLIRHGDRLRSSP